MNKIDINKELENIILEIKNYCQIVQSDAIKFLKTETNKYDIILFDSPPLIAVTDAFVLLREVEKFILVSPDKAVHPVNVMGATNRLSERIIQTVDKVSQTQ